jgi:hypothetical protein
VYKKLKRLEKMVFEQEQEIVNKNLKILDLMDQNEKLLMQSDLLSKKSPKGSFKVYYSPPAPTQSGKKRKISILVKGSPILDKNVSPSVSPSAPLPPFRSAPSFDPTFTPSFTFRTQPTSPSTIWLQREEDKSQASKISIGTSHKSVSSVKKVVQKEKEELISQTSRLSDRLDFTQILEDIKAGRPHDPGKFLSRDMAELAAKENKRKEEEEKKRAIKKPLVKSPQQSFGPSFAQIPKVFHFSGSSSSSRSSSGPSRQSEKDPDSQNNSDSEGDLDFVC